MPFRIAPRGNARCNGRTASFPKRISLADDRSSGTGSRPESHRFHGLPENARTIGRDSQLVAPIATPEHPKKKTHATGDGDEVLLQHLERDNARSVAPVLRGQIDRAALFRRRTFVVRVYENIGVEKATSVHGFRRD